MTSRSPHLGMVDRLSDDLLDSGSYLPVAFSQTATSPSSFSELLDERHSYGCHNSDEMARSQLLVNVLLRVRLDTPPPPPAAPHVHVRGLRLCCAWPPFRGPAPTVGGAQHAHDAPRCARPAPPPVIVYTVVAVGGGDAASCTGRFLVLQLTAASRPPPSAGCPSPFMSVRPCRRLCHARMDRVPSPLLPAPAQQTRRTLLKCCHTGGGNVIFSLLPPSYGVFKYNASYHSA